MTDTKIRELIDALAHGTRFENIEASEGLSPEELGAFSEKYAEDICKRRAEIKETHHTDAKPFRAYGIDVSAWQGVIEWKRVKRAQNGAFAILRAAYSLEEDVRFEQNYLDAHSAGIPVGAYLYSTALTPEEAEREAERLLQLVKGKALDYPLALDIEESAQAQLGREMVSEIIEAFCSRIEAEGYYVCVYSYEDFIVSCLTEEIFEKYDIWVSDICGEPTVAYGLHQYSFTGDVLGIRGNVDLDVAVKDYPKILQEMKKRRKLSD
ncbi:MAG: hypothetical protein IJ561_08170 [Ruminococcus sp.]|nr:hypothetical protein [Ruminococcus sp.]